MALFYLRSRGRKSIIYAYINLSNHFKNKEFEKLNAKNSQHLAISTGTRGRRGLATNLQVQVLVFSYQKIADKMDWHPLNCRHFFVTREYS